MMKALKASLLLALAVASASPAALADDGWKDEPIREVLLLPVRGAAVGTSLIVTAPGQAFNGAKRALNSIMPEKTSDVELMHVVAAPAFAIGGAILAPIEAAPKRVEVSWTKPFSSESFSGITE